jgi:surface antigen
MPVKMSTRLRRDAGTPAALAPDVTTNVRLGTLLKLAPVLLTLSAGCSSATSSEDATASSSSDAVSGGTIASIALANVGKGACSANSEGSAYFDSSCTGNGGQPEYWCADFARWVWGAAGVDTSGLTAAAGSFYVYGQNHGTLSSTPQVGDAVVFNYHGGGSADHVAIVTQVNGNGTIETVSGDWAGQSGSEAFFSSTSHVVLNAPAYYSGVGSYAGEMGMDISGFIAPIGGVSEAVGANGCTAQETANAGHFGCACVDHGASGGFCDGTGCTAEATNDAAKFGCACVDGSASGGFCDGTGCTAKETNDAAKFGCACVDHQAAGGFCPGNGCTVKETNDAAKFGCACVDHQASGGFCDGTGCTELETRDAAKFGCYCVDHQGNGGACAGTGCTIKETNDCAHFGAKCSAHACVK